MKTALLIVDMQNDFMPGGALPVPNADKLVPFILQLISMRKKFDYVFAGMDWHPKNHISFRTRGGPWPIHCVAETEGAELVGPLKDAVCVSGGIIRKGALKDTDSYSMFYDNGGRQTELVKLIAEGEYNKVSIVGVALEVCVKVTAEHALKMGLQTEVLTNGCASLTPEGANETIESLRAQGVRINYGIEPFFQSKII